MLSLNLSTTMCIFRIRIDIVTVPCTVLVILPIISHQLYLDVRNKNKGKIGKNKEKWCPPTR